MSTVEKLRKLALMREKGVLTEAEYLAAKRELLSDVPDAEETPVLMASTPSDLGSMIAISVLSALVLGLLSMLFFSLSVSSAATLGIAALGLFTILLYRSLTDDDEA